MKKKLVLWSSLVLAVSVYGQNLEQKHYLGVNLGGGWHSLSYSAKNGDRAYGAGGLLQVQYQYMLNKNWGVGGGLGFSTLHSSALYNYENNGIMFKNLREKQDLCDIDITMQGFYFKPVAPEWTLEGGLGLSLNIPVSMRYNINYKDGSGSIKHKGANIGLQVDLGALHPLKDNLDLYLGLYFNYQFISSVESSNDPMYFRISTPHYNSSLNSYQVDGVHPLMFGVKVGVRFGLGKFVKTDAKSAKTTKSAKFNLKNAPMATFRTMGVQPKFDKGANEWFSGLKDYMNKKSSKKIYLTGYTDNTGKEDLNMRLSKDRAEAYKKVLVGKGISADAIVTEGKGAVRPISDNNTVEGRAKNRRVEMKVK